MLVRERAVKFIPADPAAFAFSLEPYYFYTNTAIT